MNEPRQSLSLQPAALSVPVFNCIVHVLRDGGGSVTARCANLPNLSYTAATEREVLSKVVTEFKRRTREQYEDGTAIEWIEPPSPKTAEEQTRLIPVHL